MSEVRRLLAFRDVLHRECAEWTASLKFNIHTRQLVMNVVGEEDENWVENRWWFILELDDGDVEGWDLGRGSHEKPAGQSN